MLSLPIGNVGIKMLPLYADFRATAKKPPTRVGLLFVKASASPRTGFKTIDLT